MHKKFLEEWIQAQTLPIAHDYAKLKAWLLENYRDPEAIIKDILEHLESHQKASRPYPLNPGHPSSLAVVAWRPKHRFFSSKHRPEHSEAKLWHKNDVFDEK